MKKVILLGFGLLLVTSCATGVKVIPGNCGEKAQWSQHNEKFEKYSYKVWSFFSVKEFHLVDYDDDLDCKNIREMDIVIRQTFFDALLGLSLVVRPYTVEVFISNDEMGGL